MKTVQKILTLFIGIGAVVGAVMMWLDPTGTSWGGEPLLEMIRARMPWPDVFFRNFTLSGFVLLAVNGIPQFVATYMLFKNHPLAQWTVRVCGLILVLWIALEWWIWGLNTMSNVFMALGLMEAASAGINKCTTEKCQ